MTYSYRTDAVHTDPKYTTPEAAVAAAVEAKDWAPVGSKHEDRDIADGAWLTVFDSDGVAVFFRGEMP